MANGTQARGPAGTKVDLLQRTLADRHLQSEIDKALATLARDLPLLVDLRLARVVSTLLEPAWTEHANFQDDALFPLIARASAADRDLRAMLTRLGTEHDEIGERQAEIGRRLERLIAGHPGAANPALGVHLEQTLALRRNHYAAESAVVDSIPATLSAGDRATLQRWMRERGAAPFPVNLILDQWD